VYIHQIRNTLRFLNYKERKAFAQELKEVYKAQNEKTGYTALENLSSRYPEYSQHLNFGILIGLN